MQISDRFKRANDTASMTGIAQSLAAMLITCAQAQGMQIGASLLNRVERVDDGNELEDHETAELMQGAQSAAVYLAGENVKIEALVKAAQKAEKALEIMAEAHEQETRTHKAGGWATDAHKTLSAALFTFQA